MAEMPFAEHNNMVKTIPPDRTDQPLRISVLPWRAWRDRPIPYTHCSKPLDDDIAIDAIPIANEISRRLSLLAKPRLLLNGGEPVQNGRRRRSRAAYGRPNPRSAGCEAFFCASGSKWLKRLRPSLRSAASVLRPRSLIGQQRLQPLVNPFTPVHQARRHPG